MFKRLIRLVKRFLIKSVIKRKLTYEELTAVKTSTEGTQQTFVDLEDVFERLQDMS